MVGSQRMAFICGARMAGTRRETYHNIRKAAETAVAVARKGYAVLLPHTMSTLPELFGNLGEPYWIETCRVMIRRLHPGDVVVLVPDNWRNSDNACCETVLADERGIPVYELEHLPDAN